MNQVVGSQIVIKKHRGLVPRCFFIVSDNTCWCHPLHRRSLRPFALFQTFKQWLQSDIAWTIGIILIEFSLLVINQEEWNATYVERLA